MMRLSILTAAVSVLLPAWISTVDASEIYQWTDDDGIVHFSDARPEDGAVATTLQVRDTNPPGYDPVTDPYSIRNQAQRTNATWTELEEARKEREERRREEAERNLRYAAPPYDPYLYYSRPAYFAPAHPRKGRRHQQKTVRRQLHALEELGLTGPRRHSINSGGHRARVLKSQDLPTTTPKFGPRPKVGHR